MHPNDSPGKLLFLLLLLLAVVAAFPVIHYLKVYRPAVAAAQTLARLLQALQRSGPNWRPAGGVETNNFWHAIVRLTGSQKIHIAARGSWRGTAVSIEYKLLYESDSLSLPERTIIHMASRRPPLLWSGVSRFDRLAAGWHHVGKLLTSVPSMKHVVDDYYVWGPDDDIARLVSPAVWDRVRALPRELFGAYGTEGLVLKDGEARLGLMGHVDDPALIAECMDILHLVVQEGDDADHGQARSR